MPWVLAGGPGDFNALATRVGCSLNSTVLP